MDRIRLLIVGVVVPIGALSLMVWLTSIVVAPIKNEYDDYKKREELKSQYYEVKIQQGMSKEPKYSKGCVVIERIECPDGTITSSHWEVE